MTLATGVAMLFGGQAYAQYDCCQPAAPILYGGVGPVIAGSINIDQLPKDARDFMQRHFKEYTVVQCEKEFDDNTYEVEFSDGTDVEFDNKGNWIEIDAGRSRILPESLVKKLIPDMAKRELEERGVLSRVESVKRYYDGYKVEIRNAKYDDYRFDNNGKLLIVKD